jgi:23S rRNA (cytidine1920-2'-O)/16S rRNA (cytidine1409-2'-O)-methyltransferase
MARRRADAVLADKGIFASREQARAAILAGEVRVGDTVLRKAGELVDEETAFEIAERQRFVSRGGDKLAGALQVFDVPVTGKRAIDVGASTGGFTDCLLQAGAASVVAVDVGYGQLAWTLRNDARVTVFERTNIRSADVSALGAPFDIVVADVSFISLRKVLPQLVLLMDEVADVIALVKPQFEAGKERVGKRGVVRDPAVHEDVLRAVVDAVREAGLTVRGLTFSPVKGPEGNIEFWLWASRGGPAADIDPAAVVAEARDRLGG